MIQSCAKQFGYSLFKNSEETIHCAGIIATSYEPPWFFAYGKTPQIFFDQPNNQKPKTKKTKQKSFSGLRQFSMIFHKNFMDWSLG